MQLDFLGAAGTVTGSKTLLTWRQQRLVVDYGLFQGYKNLRLLNWEPPAFDVAKLSTVVLTHGHLDHSGALPLLVKQGFRGRIFATPSTIETCAVLLPDSARLQEEDAEYLGRHHRSRHAQPLPLYTEEDANRVQKLFEPLPFDSEIALPGGMKLCMKQAGHILGAASAEISADGTTVVFSGDLGRPDDLLMRAPAPLGRADYVIMESTYGDRLHGNADPVAMLGDIIRRVHGRGGTVIIPAFAVGRAQTLLYAIYCLKAAGRIPDVPVYLNSPMAIDMTSIYERHQAEHRLSREQCAGMCHVARMVHTAEESKALNAGIQPAIIIAGSGMATGGRVLHHLKAMGPDARNAIVFAGFQAGGTRGARLLAGERRIRIHGEEVDIHAEVLSLPHMSAHADAGQLMGWLRTAEAPPKRIFLNHGEPGPADTLRQRIESELGWPAMVPRLGQQVRVGA
jgi:metallo-beta-lactamase family protein